MVKTYKAFVTDRETKKSLFLEIEETSKLKAKKEIWANGYSIYRIEEKDFYNYLLDNTNMEEKEIKEARKNFKNNNALSDIEKTLIKNLLLNKKEEEEREDIKRAIDYTIQKIEKI